jgi:predicted RNase H-like nuclease (RuvC/YqgF family)
MTGAQLDAMTAQLSVLASHLEQTEGLAAQAEAAAAAERAQNALTLQQLAEARSGQAEAVLVAEEQAAELQELQEEYQTLGHTLIDTEAKMTALETQNLHLTQQAARQVMEVTLMQAELQESNGRISSLKRQLTAMNRVSVGQGWES